MQNTDAAACRLAVSVIMTLDASAGEGSGRSHARINLNLKGRHASGHDSRWQLALASPESSPVVVTVAAGPVRGGHRVPAATGRTLDGGPRRGRRGGSAVYAATGSET